jgi:hypothetical protein
VVISNCTGLLSFIPGATETISKPETAPVGIVTVREVADHELIVTGASFRYTALLPTVVPNPLPVITI